ncbi:MULTISPECIES: hypothetical protein [Sphingobacterium]|uniref:hypothetical protein n=1 Tax=Sphingobacterium TaxID=28453 RepID=UPI0013D8F5C9|nr:MULTISPECIES: hypothetical protein [unclassified Sphingobacterium]
MNTAIYYGLGLLTSSSMVLQSNIERLRQNYPLAVKDKNVCKAEIEQLQDTKATNPLEMAYHGAYLMVWADHLSTPISKLNSFKDGKKLIDAALKKRYGDPEIHFLRLTIQQNAPAILNYNKDIQQDTNQIIEHWDSIASSKLKTQIKDFLLLHKLVDNKVLNVLKT